MLRLVRKGLQAIAEQLEPEIDLLEKVGIVYRHRIGYEWNGLMARATAKAFLIYPIDMFADIHREYVKRAHTHRRQAVEIDAEYQNIDSCTCGDALNALTANHAPECPVYNSENTLTPRLRFCAACGIKNAYIASPFMIDVFYCPGCWEGGAKDAPAPRPIVTEGNYP